MTSSHKRVYGAFLVGSALILGAFLVKTNIQSESGEGTLAVSSYESAPRAYIATSDQDGDGIPDWQSALQRTEPIITRGIDETYEIPDTLTDQFAISFFQDMVRADNYGEFGVSTDEIIAGAEETFTEAGKDELYGIADIRMQNDNSVEALRVYGNALASIALTYTLPEDAPSEGEILKRALETNNESLLENLQPYIDGYEDMLGQLLLVPVPSAYSTHHLDLVNALSAVHNDLVGMQRVFDDPLYAIIRIKRFQEDVAAMQLTILNIQKQMVLDEVTFTSNDPVYTLFSL